jgi:hypothetical protein
MAACLTIGPRDSHRTVTVLTIVGALAVGLLAVLGVPRVDLHGPLHHVGVMDPLCGGTRAAFLLARGRWVAAWTYNPIVFPLAAVAVALLARAAVGLTTRRWLTVRFARRRPLIVLLVIAVALLEVRQQMHADLLSSAWSGVGFWLHPHWLLSAVVGIATEAGQNDASGWRVGCGASVSWRRR